MASEDQAEFLARCDRLPNVEAITFDAHMESLLDQAVGVVAMGGYNTFCEILSFDKRALIVPRTVPRMEQFIRASRARDLGLARMLQNDGVRDAAEMASALQHLVEQALPSEHMPPGMLAGLDNVNALADRLLQRNGRRTGAIPTSAALAAAGGEK